MNRFKNEEIKRKAQLLFMVFGDNYSEFKTGGYKDDRIVFCNIFEAIIKMLSTADKVYGENTTLDVAINRQYREDYNELEEIKNRFKEMGKAL